MKRDEMFWFSFCAVMVGWVTSPWHGIAKCLVALAGLSASSSSEFLRWDTYCPSEKRGTHDLVPPLLTDGRLLERGWGHQIISEMSLRIWEAALEHTAALGVTYLYVHYCCRQQ